ncbi:CDP-alcohol phosphatidyltransferase family protein [Methylosinus sp. KRF6]|uniref:CDP-alcohol phosphatidyltransferase family protein n=1 Tax=Methylosinus sp. KRF6 TaxID=2846853 RepID=UPI001C0C2FE2|nr:CDP-alcohol phosphatidyltransferase family protein [Methylosinus sp. KRF6]MBU3890404.1 CDP-alcohol phosphatidyltransferase family protein [Methylosinus sp. KRF6]
MTLYALKPRFQALLRPAVARAVANGVTANRVTVATAAISCLLGLALVWSDRPGLFLVLPPWLFLRMALNAVDGMMAREFRQQSLLGIYLNEICDVVSDAALVIPFASVAPFDPSWIFAVIFLAAISEYAGVMGPLAGAGRRYDGPFGKSDRAFAFGALGLAVGLLGALPQWAGWIMPFFSLLLVVTTINRVRRGVAEAGLRKDVA